MTRPLSSFCTAIPRNVAVIKNIRLAAVLMVLLLNISTSAEVKEIDIHRNPVRNKYFLVFAARGDSADGKSITGHAFVIWGIEDYKTKTSSYKAWGFYPQDLSLLGQARAVIGPVPGNIVDEALKGSLLTVSDSLILRVDLADYLKAEKVLNDYAVMKDFQLETDDCLDFMIKVGESIGLPMPTRFFMTEFPQRYLKAFVEGVNPNFHREYPDGSVYDGPIVNGMFFGKAVDTFSDKSKYIGMFRRGVFDGYGRFFSSSGYRIEGQFKKGYIEGNATLTTADGSVLQGDFTEGNLNGLGTAILADKRKYEGVFKGGIPNGPGKVTLPDGTVGVGTFANGQFEGEAKTILPDGRQIEGLYHQGKLDGPGKMTYPDGLVFDGHFVNGGLDGAVKLSYPDGLVFDGRYVNGSLDRDVKLSYPDGDRFEGVYQNGALTSGTLIEKNGNQWQGPIVNGQMQGPGVYTKEGVRFEGVYENGVFHYSDSEEPDGIERNINVPDKKYRATIDLWGPYDITLKTRGGDVVDHRIIQGRNK